MSFILRYLARVLMNWPLQSLHKVIARVVVLLVASASFIGSTVAQPENTGTVRPRLVQSGTLWPNGQVPVCFNIAPTSAPYPEVAWFKSALEHAWAAVAKVDFQYAYCGGFVDKDNVRVDFTLNTSNCWSCIGGGCGIGVGRPNVCRIDYCPGCTPLVDYEEFFKALVVHEFGHVLGFAHEHQRDSPDTPSPPTCLAFAPEPQRADFPSGPDGDAAYQDAHNGWQGNWIDRVTGGVNLTDSYDADSIMNYCRGTTATDLGGLARQSGYQAADRLSVGDLYGVQQAYGIRMPYWLIVPAAE
jgi:hypothetical protein